MSYQERQKLAEEIQAAAIQGKKTCEVSVTVLTNLLFDLAYLEQLKTPSPSSSCIELMADMMEVLKKHGAPLDK